jgi:hypothetical protein
MKVELDPDRRRAYWTGDMQDADFREHIYLHEAG